MSIIRISTDLELTIHDFPAGTYAQQKEALCELIGNNCNIYQCVEPERLYSELQMRNTHLNVPGCVCMLVDEEGLLKKNEPNPVGSYLYGTDRHGCPIMGNILFVGEVVRDGGIDYCGIECNTLKLLELELNNMIYTMEEIRKDDTYGN